MGGYGSTRWGWYRAKRRVERCVKLPLGSLIKLGLMREYTSGTISIGKNNMNFRVDEKPDGYFQVTLSYTINDEISVISPIVIGPTPMPNGGKRYWFQCPADGCKQPRVRNLYLPVSGKYFYCRQCHNLVYSSSQDSRKMSKTMKQYLSYSNDPLSKALYRMMGLY